MSSGSSKLLQKRSLKAAGPPPLLLSSAATTSLSSTVVSSTAKVLLHSHSGPWLEPSASQLQAKRDLEIFTFKNSQVSHHLLFLKPYRYLLGFLILTGSDFNQIWIVRLGVNIFVLLFQVPEFASGIPSLRPLVPPLRSLPPSAALTSPPMRTPLNIPLTVQTSHSSHHPHSHHHHPPPPPLLTYPPSADMRVPCTVTSSASSGILFPPSYNLATSGVSLSIIHTNVITSANSQQQQQPRGPPLLPPVMSHSLSGGVIVVPHSAAAIGTAAKSSASSSSVIGLTRTAACGPGCQCAGPLTRSRKRKLCNGADYFQRSEASSSSSQLLLAFRTGGGKLLRSGTITLE